MAIDKFAVLADVLHNEVELRTIEDVHDFVKAIVDCFLQEGGLEERFYLECYIAENHGKVEGLHGACS